MIETLECECLFILFNIDKLHVLISLFVLSFNNLDFVIRFNLSNTLNFSKTYTSLLHMCLPICF